MKEHMKKFKKTYDIKTVVMVLLGILLLAIYLWLALSSNVADVRFNNEEATLLKEGWTVSVNGSSQAVTIPEKIKAKSNEKVILTRLLDGERIHGNALMFYARQSWVEVYLDGVLLVESEEDRKTPFDMTPGSYWYCFRLPADIEGKELQIIFSSIMDRYAGELPEIYVGTKASFIYMVLEQGKISLVLVLPVLVLGIGLCIMGLLSGQKHMRKRLFRLGTFAVVTSVWSLLESRVTQVLFGNMVLASYVLFSCFLLIPVCSVAFLLTYDSLGKRKYMKGLFWLSAISFVLAQILQIFEIAYYIELVTMVHILLGLIILGVLISYVDKKRKKEKIADSSIYSAMLILAAFCIFDIIRYYVSPIAKVGDFSKVGIMLFFVYLGISAMRQVGRLQIQEAENRMYQKLAYTDMMTGMANRTAFEVELDNYKQNPWKEITILMVADMNRLKFINDNYGHEQGDRALKQIADLMQKGFRDNCKAFRTGGDEFCVISRGNSEKHFAEMCKKFMRSIIESPQEADWLLSVSCGYCVVDESGIDECYKKADAIMYEEKVASKMQRTD